MRVNGEKVRARASLHMLIIIVEHEYFPEDHILHPDFGPLKIHIRLRLGYPSGQILALLVVGPGTTSHRLN